MKRKLTLIFAVAGVLFSLCSCSEKDEVDEYDNWEARNIQLIDSVAKVAALNADGKWEVIKAFNMGDSAELYRDNKNCFIYVHKMDKGEKDLMPLFKDSVRIHYSARVIPTNLYPQGYCFKKTYSTNVLNEATDVPELRCVGDNVVGLSTAILNMNEGDRWTVYVPYYLGYGETDNKEYGVPPFSTLIYDIKLAKIYRFGIDKDTSWY
ncbi:MAG: FKBP-type peptidyl-prolyl cis-trans isomerase [Bacteroidaceae bacterium]|nr:FKBP-type peptidyl-prolyl cis-trans isomerase [Bacteroidaceae bacterium]